MVVWQRACIDQLNTVAAGMHARSHYVALAACIQHHMTCMDMILRGNERPRGVQPASCQW